MKKLLLIFILMLCISANARPLSTASGEGRRTKNEMLDYACKHYDISWFFYTIIKMDIRTSDEISTMLIESNGRKYKITKQGKNIKVEILR